MKKRWISLILCVCMVLSMMSAMAIRAHAAETWYAPIVRHIMDENGYEWLWDHEKKGCRGTLYDMDADGFDELILLFHVNSGYDKQHCQVWDFQDGSITMVMDESTSFLYGDISAFSLQLDGKNYLAVEWNSSGTIGTYYYWTIHDPQNGYELAFTISYDYDDYFVKYPGSSEENPVSAEWAAQITAGLENTPPLAGFSYFHTNHTGRTFDDLSTAEVYRELLAYTKDQDMTILDGSEIAIRYVLYDSGEIVDDWAKPAITISNSAVAEAVGWEKTFDGYLLTVRGLRPGTANITVTDGDSKAFVTIPLTVRDSDIAPLSYFIGDVPSGYPDWFGDRETQTNFYDIDGLSVNQYKCSMAQNGYYTITFDVYNSSHMFGSVDIYDRNGNWLGSERIDKFQNPSSLYEVAEDTWFLAKDFVTLNALSYTSVAVSQKTEITARVPVGGYLVISNNCLQSPGAYIYNTVDLSMVSANALFSLLFDDSQLKEVQDEVISILSDDDAFTEAFLREFKNIADHSLEEATYKGAADSMGAITEHSQQFYDALELDFWGIVSTVCNVSEDVFLSFTMAEVSAAMNSMFAVNEYLNTLFQVRAVCSSFDNTGILLTSAQANTETVTINGVRATPEDNSVLPANAILEVFRITDQSILTAPGLGVNTEHFLLYNICYTVNNEEIQPDGSVIVQIPVPDGFDASRCVILHEKENGEWEQIPCRLENGFLVFSANHFSLFALVETEKANPFEDVLLGEWYTDPVLWAVENGITNGATETTFDPNGQCLRGQVVTFLWRAAGEPQPTGTHNPFVDVKPSDFYYTAVLWAVEAGITNGADATHFNPMGACNRAQVVTFLHRAFHSPATESGSNPFTDVPNGTWYTAPVLWAVEKGITNGVTADRFSPNSTCNRAQIVTFLHRAYTD